MIVSCRKFVNSVQQTFQGGLVAADDSLSDDLAMELPSTISLPAAEIGNLPEIEASMRIMSQTASGRDALVKCLTPPGDYIARLLPLVEMAEDLESLPDLHRLCNIMKNIILLNDTAIIEAAVSDAFVIGVVGALEYDPDFPSHKANHRHWLGNQGRYKEVVPIEDDNIRKKIHQTYRLQYLKDVVLARILDDPTFSVLNSLIFFNQVDIVQHLQGNSGFLSELFSIFKPTQPDQKKKKDAVLFIQQCCAIAKNLQPPARQTLFANFLHHGLLQVINFGLRHNDVGVRVGATDVLVALIDHDPQLIRHTIYRQITERTVPLTDSLIDLLLVECDLGVKSQISDAVKVLLDVVLSQHPPPPEPVIALKASAEFNSRRHIDVQQDVYVNTFYINSAPRLFKPLFDLKERKDMTFPLQQASIFTYLIEILCFFIRQHGHRAKQFILEHDVLRRVAQLLACPEKYLKLGKLNCKDHKASANHHSQLPFAFSALWQTCRTPSGTSTLWITGSCCRSSTWCPSRCLVTTCSAQLAWSSLSTSTHRITRRTTASSWSTTTENDWSHSVTRTPSSPWSLTSTKRKASLSTSTTSRKRTTQRGWATLTQGWRNSSTWTASKTSTSTRLTTKRTPRLRRSIR